MQRCKPLPPMSKICSNHGYCDSTTGKCVCYRGFSSFVDFNFTEGVDCDQVASLLQVLGLLCVIVAGVVTIFNLRILHLKIFRARVSLDSVTFTITIFLFYSLSTTVFGAIKVLHPFRIIGRDLAPTISACSCAFFFTTGCGCLVAIIGTVFKRQARVRSVDETDRNRINQLFDIHRKLFYVAIPMTIIGSFWPFVIFLFPQFDNSMFIFFAFIWMVLAFYLVVFLIGLKRMQSMLSSRSDAVDNLSNLDDLEEASARKMATRRLHDRLSLAYKITLSVCSCVMVILLCFQFWPMMNRMVSYGLIVTYTMGSCCALFWVRMFAHSGPIFSGCGEEDATEGDKGAQHNLTSEGTQSGYEPTSDDTLASTELPKLHELGEFSAESRSQEFTGEFMLADAVTIPCRSLQEDYMANFGALNVKPGVGQFPRVVQPTGLKVSWGTVTVKTYDELTALCDETPSPSKLTGGAKPPVDLENNELELLDAASAAAEGGGAEESGDGRGPDWKGSNQSEVDSCPNVARGQSIPLPSLGVPDGIHDQSMASPSLGVPDGIRDQSMVLSPRVQPESMRMENRLPRGIGASEWRMRKLYPPKQPADPNEHASSLPAFNAEEWSNGFPHTQPLSYFKVNQIEPEIRERPPLLENVFESRIFCKGSSVAAVAVSDPISIWCNSSQQRHQLHDQYEPKNKYTKERQNEDGGAIGVTTTPNNPSAPPLYMDGAITPDAPSVYDEYEASSTSMRLPATSSATASDDSSRGGHRTAADLAVEQYEVFAIVGDIKPFFLVDELYDVSLSSHPGGRGGRGGRGDVEEGRTNNRFLAGNDV